MRIELTSGSPSFEEVTSDSPDDDLQIIGSSEPILGGESPIAGMTEAKKSEPGDEREHEDSDDDDDDFEFTFEGIDRESDWYDRSGEIFPIFDRRLLSEAEARAVEAGHMEAARSALGNLFVVDDRDHDAAAELDGAAPESYCVWTPGISPRASPARCKKSRSTGTTAARRWGVSLRELLIRRSRSDGNGRGKFVRFGSRRRTSESGVETAAEKEAVGVKKAVVRGGGEKRRETYLPYKQAIVGFGFFPRVNGFGGVNGNRPPF
uniref:Uncharacterized protein n=1 Tax=Kalanchoe fedtschenkoi TaxID=63787 RepID=A0A7N1A0R9_KALFE